MSGYEERDRVAAELVESWAGLPLLPRRAYHLRALWAVVRIVRIVLVALRIKRPAAVDRYEQQDGLSDEDIYVLNILRRMQGAERVGFPPRAAE